MGTQVLTVMNFHPKRIAGFMSEVFVRGASDANGEVVLVQPRQEIANGVRLY